MGEATRIDTERDANGITLSFVRPEKLKPSNQSVGIELTPAKLENKVATHASVEEPVVQYSSATSLKKGEKLLDTFRCNHAFLSTALTAWSCHRPLVLSPDHFWLMILQAVALHVNLNSEELRHGFVKHDGRKTLEIRRDEFVLDSRSNDWAGVIKEFNDKLRETTVADVVPLLQPQFSTTGMVEELAGQLTLMNVLMSYHEYVVRTLCGFPWVRMEGTASDWGNLRKHTEELLESGKLKKRFAKRWSKVLLPVLAKLEDCANGDPELGFWDRMIKLDGVSGSGGPRWLNGWVNVFLPLIKGDENPLCFSKGHGLAKHIHGTDLFTIPRGLCSTPITWKIFNKAFELQAVAGFVGMTESEQGALRPEVAVVLARSGKQPTGSDAVKKLL